jgi:hypothetical protein
MPSTGITHHPIMTDILTGTYRVVGTVMAPPSGLIGIFNDINTSFIEVENAQLARLHTPNYVVDRYETMRLVKSHILAVCAGRREDLGSGAAPRSAFGRVGEYPIFITSGDLEIEGIIEWAGLFNPDSVLAELMKIFFPLFHIVVQGIIFPDTRVTSAAALINGARVEQMGITSQRKPLEM